MREVQYVTGKQSRSLAESESECEEKSRESREMHEGLG